MVRWGLWLLLFSAGVRAQQSAVSLWDTVLSLHEDPSLAWSTADEVNEVLSDFAKEIRVDDAAAQLLHRVHDAVLGLNLKRLWRMLPEGDETERRLHVVGRPVPGQAYELALAPEAAPSTVMGALDAALHLAPWTPAVSGRDTYRLGLGLSVGSGSIDPVALMHGVETWLQLLQSDLVLHGDGLGMALQRAAPDMYRATSRYLSLRQRGATDADRMHADLSLCADLSREGWSERRHMARYLKRLSDLIQLRADVLDTRGERLLTVTLDSESRCITLEAMFDEGQALSFSSLGTRGRTAVSLTETPDLAVRVMLEGRFHFRGFRVVLSELDWLMRFGSQSSQAFFQGAMADMPSLELSGQGAFTSWLMGIMETTLDLDGHTSELFRGLADGPEGRGTWLALRHEQQRVHFVADTLMVDNGVIRLAAQVLGGRIMPSDAVLGDLYEGLSDMIDGYVGDYERIRPSATRGPVTPAPG